MWPTKSYDLENGYNGVRSWSVKEMVTRLVKLDAMPPLNLINTSVGRPRN